MTNIKAYHSNSKEYDNWFEENHLIYASELEAIKALLPSKIENGIELGGGTGRFAEQLGIKIGLEPSLNMAEKAQERGVEVIQGFIEDMSFKDNSFSFALMDCYLEDLAAAFHEVHRIVEDGGFLLIGFIDADTPLGRIYQKNKSKSIFYRDANFHSRDGIRSALKDAGFKITGEKQTIFSVENIYHETKDGLGEGLFAVIKAKKVAKVQGKF